ncbi:hypothetical protein PILCRDRAFT_9780, partial [Piloderma croceum F 1598]
ASSRASSLAPSKSLAVSSGTLTPQAPPNGESTNTSSFAESLWSINKASAGEARAEVESEDRDGTAEDSSSDNESSDSSDGDDIAEEPEVGKGKQRHDPYADWDNGEPLTPEECTQIMKLSTYERAREMNIRRRKRMEVSLQSEFRALAGDLKETLPRSLPASSGKHVPDGPTHCSSRNKAADLTSASKPSKPSPLGVNIPLTSIESTDSPIEIDYNYPNRSSWPSWITEAMQELDLMSDQLEWKECVAAWLEMEHRLGYPVGMVIISNVLSKFLEVALNMTSRQKKEHKLDKDRRPDVITNWQKSGCNLGWWALGLKHAEVNSTSYGMEDLLNAIEDTMWVLQQMALPRSTSTKRPQSEDDNSDINAKRIKI